MHWCKHKGLVITYMCECPGVYCFSYWGGGHKVMHNQEAYPLRCIWFGLLFKSPSLPVIYTRDTLNDRESQPEVKNLPRIIHKVEKSNADTLYPFILSFQFYSLRLPFSLQGKDLRIRTGQEEVELRPSEDHIHALPLKEDSFTIHGTGFPVSRKEFMTVLVDLKRILIQIKDSLGVDAIYR